MAEVTRYYVSEHLSIVVSPEDGIALVSGRSITMMFDAAELPALLDRLQEAAEGMGVATARGEMVQQRDELVAALTALREEYFNLIVFLRMHHIQITDAALQQAQQALASVKR